jgi:hypothetical protein
MYPGLPEADIDKVLIQVLRFGDVMVSTLPSLPCRVTTIFVQMENDPSALAAPEFWARLLTGTALHREP